MLKFLFVFFGAFGAYQVCNAQAPAVPYVNEGELASATVTQISIHEAVAQRIMSWCDSTAGYDKDRVARTKENWRLRNSKALIVNEAIKTKLRKLNDTARAVVDEDIPQLAAAGATMYTLAGELAAKRSPDGMVRLCDQTLAAVDQGKFDIENRVDSSVKAYVEKLSSKK